MSIIRKPDQMQINQYGDGCTETILADRHMLASPVMVTRRWSLKPHAKSPQITCGDYEDMLYVISGNGVAYLEVERYDLQPESMVWLEPGDTCHLEAGPSGLEVLEYCAPDK